MNVKQAIVVIVSIGCIILLITSYLIWQARLESVANNASASEFVESEKEPENQKIDEDIETGSAMTSEELFGLIQNMDEETQEIIRNRFEQKEKVQLLIVGSEAMNDGSPGYAERLQLNLSEAYGEFFEVDVSSFDGSVTEFDEQIDEGPIDWEKGYDIVLLEPFTVNNNGVVIVEDAFENILSIEGFIQENVEDAQLIVHPSYPIFGSVYYPVEVNALKEYSLASGLTYIDHWTAWSSSSDEQLETYFNEDRTVNSEGANLWSNTLSTYFIGN